MNRMPNRNNEFLLDVTPQYLGERVIAKIYDLTAFLPAGEHPTRTAHLSRVHHTVKGKHNTIYICDFYGILTKQKAVNLAIAWYEGKTASETN